MQNKSMDELSDYIIDEMCIYYKDRFKDFCVKDIFDSAYNKSFSITLIAYEYFPIIFTYDRGRIGCSICFGNINVGLKNLQQWWEEVDLHTFFEELQTELELRIPDKFLQAHGWL